MKITGLVTIATLSVTMAAGAAFAETTSVSRCNTTEGATQVPALWITKDGVTKLTKIGENGLTRRIMFDDQLAMDFVREQMGSSAGSSHVSFTNSCSSASYSYSAEEPVAIKVAVTGPATEEKCLSEECMIPVDCGPAYCGPTDCGPTYCGPTDCGPTYCGPTDCGPTYCGPTDCGPTYCGPTDCGPTNCGPTDCMASS